MIAKNSLPKYKRTSQKFNIDVESLLWLPNNLGVFWKNLDGYYLGCSDRAVELAGFDSLDCFIGASDFDLPIRFEEAKALRDGDIKVIAEGKPKNFQYTCTQHDRVIQLLTFKAPLLDVDGKIVGVYGIDNFMAAQDLNSTLNLLKEAGIPTKDIQATFDIHLSARQQECLFYLVKGMTMKEIARELDLSPKTVENYLAIIRVKFNCLSRSQLIAKALQLPFIKARLSSRA